MKPLRILIIGIFLTLFLAFTRTASANEGTVTMSSAEGVSCQAFSVEVIAGKYSVLTRCANLTYPPSSTATYYFVWSALNDERPNRLGDLQLGRAEYTASEPFSRLFVTIEQRKNPLNPSNEVVMEGTLRSFVFDGTPVEEITQPTATPRAQATTPPGQPTSALARITSFLLRAGIIILIIVAIGGAIYYIISKFR
jgi:hypothetical protein